MARLEALSCRQLPYLPVDCANRVKSYQPGGAGLIRGVFKVPRAQNTPAPLHPTKRRLINQEALSAPSPIASIRPVTEPITFPTRITQRPAYYSNQAWRLPSPKGLPPKPLSPSTHPKTTRSASKTSPNATVQLPIYSYTSQLCSCHGSAS